MVIQNWNTQKGTEKYLFLEVLKTLLGKTMAYLTLSNGILPVYLLLLFKFISSYATKFHKNSQSRKPKITKIGLFRFF